MAAYGGTIAPAHVLAALSAEAATPTDRLMLTRLEQTILAIRVARRTGGPVAARLAADAWAWIDAPERGSQLGFESLCARFGLDGRWLRDTLRRA
jgi:hypothetical protein